MSDAERTRVEGERAELEARQKREGQTYWAIVRSQFRKNTTGMIGLWAILGIVAIAVLAPLLANDRPVVARFKGSTHFPAFTTYVDSWVFWPSARSALKSWEVAGTFPFGDHYEELGNKTWEEALGEHPDEAGLVVWPPIRWSPRQIDKGAVKQRPGDRHLVGADDRGRDVLARLIHGCVVAVTVGIVATGVAALIGVTLGTLAGFFGGRIDLVLCRMVEVVMCFPTFFIIIAVISFLEPSIMNIMLVIGLFGWTGMFRLVRGEVLKCKAMDYVVAARAQGVAQRRIMFNHILPNAISPVFVSISFAIAGAVLTEASLTFLGFGDATVPSWGEIVSQGRQYVQEDLTHLIVPAGIAIFVTLTAFNLFGQGLRDAMDPRLRH